VAQICFNKLKQAGAKGVIFDKDNTLTWPYVTQVETKLKVLREAYVLKPI